MKSVKTDLDLNGNNITNIGNIYSKDEVDAKAVELTQAQYDALSDEEKNNGTIYFVPDTNDVNQIPEDFEMLGYKTYCPTVGTYLLCYVTPTGYSTTIGDTYEVYIAKSGKIVTHGTLTITSTTTAPVFTWNIDRGEVPSELKMCGPAQASAWGVIGYGGKNVTGMLVTGLAPDKTTEIANQVVPYGTDWIQALYIRSTMEIYMRKL